MTPRRTPSARRAIVAIGGIALVGAATLVACKIPSATDEMKSVLERHGQIDAEWEVRDDANKKTHTYVLLRNKSNTHETYEIIATDGQRSVNRSQIGGIDGTGCYLLEGGLTSPWITNLPAEAMEGTRMSGDKTRTKCLEYKDNKAWVYVPAADRKAAEPPPAPPKPATGPDAGTSDGPDAGADEPKETSGDVDSVL